MGEDQLIAAFLYNAHMKIINLDKPIFTKYNNVKKDYQRSNKLMSDIESVTDQFMLALYEAELSEYKYSCRKYDLSTLCKNINAMRLSKFKNGYDDLDCNKLDSKTQRISLE